jgi:hypothetical protein
MSETFLWIQNCVAEQQQMRRSLDSLDRVGCIVAGDYFQGVAPQSALHVVVSTNNMRK